MSDLRSRTLSGLLWNFINRFGQQFVMIIVSIILARMLAPRMFGLVGLLTVFTGFAAVFAEMGLGAALIQKEDVSDLHLSSVFWINCLCGVAMTLLFVAMAPVIAWFYAEPVLFYLTCALSINFTTSALSIVHMTLLTRQLTFKPIAIARIISSALAGVLAIGMAYQGFGVWSIVGQSIFAAVLLTILLWSFCDWRPKRVFCWSTIKGLSGFGLSYVGTQTMNYWVRNIDKLLIGRFWGAGQLGIYGMAYRILLFPVSNFATATGSVLFPALSQIQGEKERVKNIFLKASRSIAVITFPVMLGLLAASDNFVTGVFGEKWIGMVGVLRIFCVLGMAQSVSAISGSLFLSQGRADLQFKVGIALRLFIIAGIVIGLRWGILGVATGYALTSLACLYPVIYFSGRLVNLTFQEFIGNLAGVSGVAVFMAGCMFCLSLIMPEEWSALLCLAIQSLLGAVVYIGLARATQLKAYREVADIIYGFFGKTID